MRKVFFQNSAVLLDVHGYMTAWLGKAETVNHLDKFIPNLATVIEPSTGLLRKDTELFQCHMNKIKHVNPVQEKNCNPIQKSYLSEL